MPGRGRAGRSRPVGNSGGAPERKGSRWSQRVTATSNALDLEPGVPHEVFNMSQTEPVVAVVARSDADEWAHIVNYDRATGKIAE